MEKPIKIKQKPVRAAWSRLYYIFRQIKELVLRQQTCSSQSSEKNIISS